MKKHLSIALALSIILLSTAISSNAQNKSMAPESDIGSLGFGIGADFGGFGINYAVFPQRNIGIFGGVGYAIAGVGYNFGVKFRLTPNHRFNPFIMGMYGYNAAIAVSNGDGFSSINGSDYNKIFYGPTAGIGFDYGTYKKNKGYLSVALTIPFRSPDVDNYINDLKSQGVVFKNSLSAVGFSIGYKFVMF